MRTKEAILDAANQPYLANERASQLLPLVLELLLDIRQLLMQQDTRPAVTYPKSPPPPEVKL